MNRTLVNLYNRIIGLPLSLCAALNGLTVAFL